MSNHNIDTLNIDTLREQVVTRLGALVGKPATTNMRLVAAVSGGGDSLALLYLLAGVAGLTLELAHFDHQLRPDSAEDAAFVRSHADKLGIPYHQQQADVAAIARAKGENIEHTARTLRYTFLHRVAKLTQANAIATAHTQNDQAETVMMQLLRGAGLLTGMPAKRGLVVRPLLAVSRKQLREVLAAYHLNPKEDPSNADTTRFRAWCRAVLLPLCATRNPQILEQLAHLAAVQTDIERHFDDRVAPWLSEVLELPHLQNLDLAVQRHALLRWFEQAHLPGDRHHLEQLTALIKQATMQDTFRLSLPKDHLARLQQGKLERLAPIRPKPAWFPSHTLSASAALTLLNKHHGDIAPPLEADKLAAFEPLSVRSRAPGDRIRLPAGSKKLSDLLIDRHIAREDRDHIPLLASDQMLAGDQNVLWVAGVAADVRVAAPKQPSAQETWMHLALAEARRAAERGEVPVGAVVVCEGEVIATASNGSEQQQDPTAHAELLAIRKAAQVRGSWRLTDCTLVVTLEPCLMCLGAIMQAHIGTVIFGATNMREGALGGVGDVLEHAWKRPLTVQGGLLAAEAQALLQTFFATKRSK